MKATVSRNKSARKPAPVDSPAGEKPLPLVASADRAIAGDDAIRAADKPAPWNDILPSPLELAHLRQVGEETRRAEFEAKLPAVLTHIAGELRQAAKAGQDTLMVDMARFAVWLDTHAETLQTYLTGQGYRAVVQKKPYGVKFDLTEPK